MNEFSGYEFAMGTPDWFLENMHLGQDWHDANAIKLATLAMVTPSEDYALHCQAMVNSATSELGKRLWEARIFGILFLLEFAFGLENIYELPPTVV